MRDVLLMLLDDCGCPKARGLPTFVRRNAARGNHANRSSYMFNRHASLICPVENALTER